MESNSINRITGLDYLRGLAATGIMIYHYMSWTLGKFDAASILGRVGLYGVSIFYILSGLTLYSVYQKKMQPGKSDLLDFFKKRGLRIFPLLWLVSLITVMLYHTPVTFQIVILNMTGLSICFNYLRHIVVFFIFSVGYSIRFDVTMENVYQSFESGIFILRRLFAGLLL